ncbi:MAG: type II/IV secretion system ATPase subunit [Candidatus Micrarchaeota archaeon]
MEHKLKTKIDELFEFVREKGRASFEEISKKLGWESAVVERVCRVLEKEGFLEVHYPLNVIQPPTVSFKKEIEEEEEVEKPVEVKEKYTISADNVPAGVQIYFSREEKRPAYELILLEVSPYTRAFFSELKDEITREVPVDTQRMTDIERSLEMRGKFMRVADEKLARLKLEKGQAEVLKGILLHSMYGLGDIELLMADDNLEEIAINNSSAPLAVYHRKFGWLKTNLRLASEEEILNYASQIGRKVGRQITVLEPILDAHLLAGDRVCATLYPISSKGNTLTIRRFARNPWTLTNLCYPNVKTISVETAAFLWQAIHYEMNLLIAGGTASGKTSMLNALGALIPTSQRVITIEDTRELNLPTYQWNWIPLVTRRPNPEGLGEVGMLDLMISSLRMRPDRILLGEIRKRQEAEVLFEAMHTGHAVASTLHADTSVQVMRRLIEPPIQIPIVELEAIHLIVVQYRDRRTNIRRTSEVSEIIPGGGDERPTLNRVYGWRPRTDEFEKSKTPIRFIDELNLHTGMTTAEITDDQKEKMSILKWMMKKKLDKIDDVGAVMKAYYTDREAVLRASEHNLDIGKIL